MRSRSYQFTGIYKRVLVVISLVAFGGVAAQAHVLEIDNAVGVVFHVTPEDSPYVGEPSTIYMEFQDESGRFALSDCDCRLVITLNARELQAHALTSPQTTVVFPERGTYRLEVRGASQSRAFAPFTVSHDLDVTRVRPGNEAKWSQYHLLHGVAFIVVFAGFFAVDWYRRRNGTGKTRTRP